MKRLLIVDDEEKIRALIRKYAEFAGYEVLEAEDGMKAVILCRDKSFDLIIMDVMMPEMDGFAAVQEIRRFADTPVLMLSARGEEYDRIHGFQLGVDDYVVKPFSLRELMLRVEAILKRGIKKSPGSEHEIYQQDGLKVDFTARQVVIDEHTVDLSPKEYDLLFYLVRNRGIALSRESIITTVWGYEYTGDDRTLDTHIKLLRRSLGTHASHIVTLRGVGYRFE